MTLPYIVVSKQPKRMATRTLLLELRFSLIFLFLLCSARSNSQPCTSDVYRKSFNLGPPRGQFLLILPGGGTIFGGRDFYNGNQVGIVKTTPAGDVIYNKRIDGLQTSNWAVACLTRDKNVLIGSRSSLILLDTNGAILKSAIVPANWDLIYDIKTDAHGSIYALYQASGEAGSHLLTKISSDLSTIIWTETFATDYSSIYRNILVDGDRVLIPGGFPTNQGDSTVASLLCFNANNGVLLKQIALRVDGYNCWMMTAHKSSEGYLLEGYYQPNGTPFLIHNHVIIRMDDSLQLVRAVRLNGLFNTDPLYVEPDGNGGFYASSGSSLITLFHCDRNDSVTWSKASFGMGFGIGAFAISTTNLYAVEQTCWEQLKTDMNGAVGSACTGSPVDISSDPVSPGLIDKSVPVVNGQFSLGPANYPVIDKTFTLNSGCIASSSCSFVKIVGPTTVCYNGTPLVMKGRRDPGCSLPVQWELKGSPVNLSTFNDSTITVQFQSGGHYQLIASLPSTCEVIADTINMDVSLSSQAPLDLGPDKELCAGNNILLNAQDGFLSYTWQDGSTDQAYTVKNPGLYYVTTTDACGGVYKDSVTITPAQAISFNVGQDRVKCNSDTIRFSAPSGFMNYSWSPAYNISSTSEAEIIANPSVDTTYFVKAEKTAGCFAFDTIHVSVYHSDAINLGADQSFCRGDSIILDGGAGFSTYLWDGSNGLRYKTIHSAGTYNVIGITTEGCRSYDTLQVTNVWMLPQVKLDHNASLCEGSTRKLNPGSFSSYKWQDGSTGSTYTVRGTGTYYVQVTDDHNCVGSDTATITTILPLPHDFLPADTTLCSYSKMTLKPSQNYSSYKWNNGNTTTNNVIDRPGTYWLEVTDNNHCVGRDSIEIFPKQCMAGVFIPTAFSPNHDSKNDVFRAMVFGVIKQFELVVYNRWGQRVFYTTDFSKGWDGKVAGVEQRSDVFVWTCHYQLEGGEESFDKGTVMIVR